MDYSITRFLLGLIKDLEGYDSFGGVVADYETAWNDYGCYIDDLIDNEDHLGLLIDYLKAEHHAGHDIDPQIQKLRWSLKDAQDIANKVRPDAGVPPELRSNIIMLGYKCSDWIGWIDRYFPPEQSKQEPGQEEPVKQDGLPFELNTEEARKYFPRAEKAGYITGHKWIGDNVRLAYFCSKVYPSNRDSQRPTTALEKFFGVKNLSAQITQIEISEPKRRASIQWRKEIDDAIFYD